MAGVVKIGFTTKQPDHRAQELSNTSVPTAFVVEYAVEVRDPERVERSVHRALSSCRAGKEFFSVSLSRARQELDRCSVGFILGSHELQNRLEGERKAKQEEAALRQSEIEGQRALHYKGLVEAEAYAIATYYAEAEDGLATALSDGTTKLRKEHRISVKQVALGALALVLLVVALTNSGGAFVATILGVFSWSAPLDELLITVAVSATSLLVLFWVIARILDLFSLKKEVRRHRDRLAAGLLVNYGLFESAERIVAGIPESNITEHEGIASLYATVECYGCKRSFAVQKGRRVSSCIHCGRSFRRRRRWSR